MLTIITPTGERDVAFSLCQKQMARQTYKGRVRWIIVDDGEKPTSITFERKNWLVEIIRPRPFWNPGDNTQGRNLLLALDRVPSDALLTVIEDDDYYSPQWLSRLVKESKKAELVGEGNAVYYNVYSRKWQRLQNREHASLRCTAMRGGAIDTFREILKRPYRYYDMRLWARHKDNYVFNSDLTVGMKGMPGRPGIALGHDGLRGNADPKCKKLREMIGFDADWYLQFYEENKMTARKPFVVKPFRYNRRDWRVGEAFEAQRRIDVELHVHAKKVEWRTVELKSKEKKNSSLGGLNVKNQEEKLAQDSVQKAPDPEPDEADKDQKKEPESVDGPVRRRGRKPTAKKDD